MGRVIAEYIKKPLADEMLFGALAKGGNVFIDAVDDEFKLSYSADKTAMKMVKKAIEKSASKKIIKEKVKV